MVSLMGSMSVAAVVWNNDCSTLDGWSYASGNGAGVYAVNAEFIQMNSWAGAGNAGWTSMWRDLGVVIKTDADYTVTLQMASFASGTAVAVSLQNVSNGWAKFVDQSISPAVDVWEDRTLSFSTRNGANAGLVGGQIGIGIEPGWWNNLGITNVSVNEVPEPATLALLGLGSLAALRRRK